MSYKFTKDNIID